MTEPCDCLNDCGDDPRLKAGKVQACEKLIALRAMPTKSDRIKQLALIHSQQCMAHHGTGPEVKAAWDDLCKALDGVA